MRQTIQLLEMTVFQGKGEQELKSKKYCAEMTMIGAKKGYHCTSKGSRENFDWCYYSKTMYNSKGEYNV